MKVIFSITGFLLCIGCAAHAEGTGGKQYYPAGYIDEAKESALEINEILRGVPADPDPKPQQPDFGYAVTSSRGIPKYALYSPDMVGAHAEAVNLTEDKKAQAEDVKKYVKALFEAGEKTREKIVNTVEKMKKDIPCIRPDIRPAKKLKRGEEKVFLDYDGNWRRLTDVLAVFFSFDSLEDLAEGLKKFKELSGLDIVYSKNRFLDKEGFLESLGNYTDLNILYRDPETGFLGEAQFLLCHMENEKLRKGGGHDVYEEYRSLEGTIKSENREPTEEEAKRMQELQDLSGKL